LRPGEQSSQGALQAPGSGVAFDQHNRFEGYKLKGLWYREARYGALRNALWHVRASRVGGGEVMNPAALALAAHEADVLLNAGERTLDLIEALCELLYHKA
jgi:hypothetical protein